MKKAVFKTNINCGNCVANVSPFLDKASSVESWEVDTTHKEKLLTVKGARLDKAEVTRLVQEAGYRLEERRRGLKGIFG